MDNPNADLKKALLTTETLVKRTKGKRKLGQNPEEDDDYRPDAPLKKSGRQVGTRSKIRKVK